MSLSGVTTPTFLVGSSWILEKKKETRWTANIFTVKTGRAGTDGLFKSLCTCQWSEIEKSKLKWSK